MIKNVIFDLDGVLRIAKDDNLKDILPKEMLTKLKVEDLGLTLKGFYKKYITGSEFIHEFDLGNLTDEELSVLVCNKFKLNKDVFDYLLKLRLKDEFNVYFLECFDFIHNLKSKGHNVYILSNMNAEMGKVLKRHLKGEPFDDILFSCDTKLLKPDPESYTYLLDKWNIDINDAIFIDDNNKNVKAFNDLGGEGFLFDRFNIEKSIDKLKKVIYGSRKPPKKDIQKLPDEDLFQK